MNSPKRGMAVFGIRGRRVGTVREVREACFEVERQDRDETLCLTYESLFTVEARDGVTLICPHEEVERYRCEEHSPSAK